MVSKSLNCVTEKKAQEYLEYKNIQHIRKTNRNKWYKNYQECKEAGKYNLR